MRINRFVAILLTLTIFIGTPASIADQVREDNSSVTYYLQGSKIKTNDALVGSQWALYNDGSFSTPSFESGHDFFSDIPDFDFFKHYDEFDPFDDFDSFDPFKYFDYFDSYFDSYFDNYFDSYFDSYFDDFFNNFLHSYANRHQDYKYASDSTQLKAVQGIDVNLAKAWKNYSKAKNTREVIVALIDTGVDIGHEDFADAFWINEAEIPDNGIDDDGNGYIDDVYGWNFYDNNNQLYYGSEDDHGTHCAGTIAASNNNGTGIASVAGDANVKIMVLKALGGRNGTGTTDAVVEAIRYAEANGADIVNLSLGSTTDDHKLYKAIAKSKMLFVIAAGNGSSMTGTGLDTDKYPCYPASYDLDNIISVANLDYSGNLDLSSNYGAASVDLAAPGTYIFSTTTGNGYQYMSGTSMAAPFVTAAAALIYSYDGSLALSDVKTRILNNVTPLDSLKDKTVSGGMLNINVALKNINK